MKLNLKSFFAGVLVMALISATTLAFAETTSTIEAIFGRVKLVVNGSAVRKETLLYDGTTYLPLREVAEILAMEVDWDGDLNIATLTSTGAVPGPLVASTEEAMTPSPTGFYRAFPNVPDLGAIIGREPLSVTNMSGMFLYTYIAVAHSDEAIAHWVSLLEEEGFEYSGVFERTDHAMYNSNTHFVTIGLSEDGLYIQILVCAMS